MSIGVDSSAQSPSTEPSTFGRLVRNATIAFTSTQKAVKRQLNYAASTVDFALDAVNNPNQGLDGDGYYGGGVNRVPCPPGYVELQIFKRKVPFDDRILTAQNGLTLFGTNPPDDDDVEHLRRIIYVPTGEQGTRKLTLKEMSDAILGTVYDDDTQIPTFGWFKRITGLFFEPAILNEDDDGDGDDDSSDSGSGSGSDVAEWEDSDDDMEENLGKGKGKGKSKRPVKEKKKSDSEGTGEGDPWKRDKAWEKSQRVKTEAIVDDDIDADRGGKAVFVPLPALIHNPKLWCIAGRDWYVLNPDVVEDEAADKQLERWRDNGRVSWFLFCVAHIWWWHASESFLLSLAVPGMAAILVFAIFKLDVRLKNAERLNDRCLDEFFFIAEMLENWTTYLMMAAVGAGYLWITDLLVPLTHAIFFTSRTLGEYYLRRVYRGRWQMPSIIHREAFRERLPAVCEGLTHHRRDFWAQNLHACSAMYRTYEDNFVQKGEKMFFVLIIFLALGSILHKYVVKPVFGFSRSALPQMMIYGALASAFVVIYTTIPDQYGSPNIYGDVRGEENRAHFITLMDGVSPDMHAASNMGFGHGHAASTGNGGVMGGGQNVPGDGASISSVLNWW